MSNNYFISAFGTFGNPNGFKQSYWFTNDKKVVGDIKTFDLNTNAIKLFPQSKLYAIRKELTRTSDIISYSLYTYAKEKNSDRSGTFIGSSILFIDKIADENITLSFLNRFHNTLEKRNLENDTIIVNHSENFSVSQPNDFDKLGFQLKPLDELDFLAVSNKNLMVFCRTNEDVLQSLFRKSINLLNAYDCIYFTDSKEISNFVRLKGLINTVDEANFEIELQKVEEEKRQKLKALISELERERENLEVERKRLIEELNSQLDNNQTQHQENQKRIEESKKDIENVKDNFSAYSKKIDEFTSALSSSEKFDSVKNSHREAKQAFSNKISAIGRFSINSISKSQVNTNLRNHSKTSNKPIFSVDYNDENYSAKKNNNKGNDEIDFFKIGMVVFFFLMLVGVILYLFVYKGGQNISLS